MASDRMPDPVRHGVFSNGSIIGEFLHFTLRLFQAYLHCPKGVSFNRLVAQDLSTWLNEPERSRGLLQGRTPQIRRRGCRIRAKAKT
jgi:hypothetical protein